MLETGGTVWAEVPIYAEFWPIGLELHGGIERFYVACEANFDRFAVCDALDHWRAIGELRSLRPNRYQTDILLASQATV